MELADCVPSTTRLDGLDKKISQAPPKAWLPTNVTFRYFNIFDEVPEELVEVYDIINIQLTLVFVLDDKIQAVLQNMLKMLSKLSNLCWPVYTQIFYPFISNLRF